MERTEQLTQASASTTPADRSYVDWPAIIAGAVVATAVGGLFTAFGAALGLSVISAEPGEGSLNFSLILTAFWMAITLVASYALGGYIAGRMRRRVDKATAEEVTVRDGINGLVVWGVAMIIGATLITNIVSGTVSATGAVAGAVTETAGATVGGMAEGALAAAGDAVSGSLPNVEFVSASLLRPTAVDPAEAAPAEVTRQTAAILRNVASTGEISEPEQAYLVSAVAAGTGLTQAEATERVATTVDAVRTAREETLRLAEEAKQAAIDAAEAARISAVLTGFLIAAASLVAAAASYIGAVRGGRHRDEGRIFGGLAYRR